MNGTLYDTTLALPEYAGLRSLRRVILDGIGGEVLELGVGTGMNLPLYPPAVTRLVGIDPDESMLTRAKERAREVFLHIDLICASAEELPFEDDSFDAVVATLAFCTIPYPAAALREVRRVLRPGGELRLLEHVRAPQEPVGWVQEKITPVWKHLAGGCHLDRDTLAAVIEAGFNVERTGYYLGGVVITIFACNP